MYHIFFNEINVIKNIINPRELANKRNSFDDFERTLLHLLNLFYRSLDIKIVATASPPGEKEVITLVYLFNVVFKFYLKRSLYPFGPAAQ